MAEKDDKGWPFAASAAPYSEAPAFEPSPKREQEDVTGVENVRYDRGAKVDNPATPQEAVHRELTAKPEPFEGSTGDDLLAWLDRQLASYKPLTPEQLKKLRKRQAARRIMTSIGDMGRAIANMLATSQYAPNAYTEQSGLSERMQARYEREKAQRDADDERWYRYAMMRQKLMADGAEAARKQHQQNVTLQLKLNEDARRQAKADYDAEMADIDLQIKMGKLDYEKARKRIADAKAALQEAYASHADELVMSQVSKNNRAHIGSGRSGGGMPAEYIVRFSDGHEERFHSEASARNNAATRGGTYITTPSTTTNTTTSRDMRGPKTKTSTVTRDVSTPRVAIDWD